MLVNSLNYVELPIRQSYRLPQEVRYLGYIILKLEPHTSAGSVLCAFGDACTSLRYEVSSVVLRKLSDIPVDELERLYGELQLQATNTLVNQGIPVLCQDVKWEADLRYRGQATSLSVTFGLKDLHSDGLQILHEQSEFPITCRILSSSSPYSDLSSHTDNYSRFLLILRLK